MDNKAKILVGDIETMPNTAYVWGLWTENTSSQMIAKEWYISTACFTWLGSGKMISYSLPDFASYKKNKEDDKEMLQMVWKLLDECDIFVAHNGRKFDVRKLYARFIMNGMKPPSPFKIVDTLESARRHFAFTSNKLGDLGKYLKVGKKVDTGGFKLWQGCMNGDMTAWEKMKRYCAADVRLLERVYKKLLPYITNHPNIGVYVDGVEAKCPNCGSHNITKEGFAFTSNGKYQRYSCNKCGSWSRGKSNLFEKQKVKNVNGL